MRLPLCIFCIIFLIPGSSAVSIVAFCPDPYLLDDPDEFLVLEGTGLLDTFSISDGEGGFRFPKGTVISGKMVIAGNAEAYRKSHGTYPDFEWYNVSPHVPDVIRAGSFRLANTRDEIQLISGTQIIQEVKWPEDVRPREGQIHYWRGGIQDPRVLLIGQSDFEAYTFENVSGLSFISPDCAYEVFTRVIDRADERLLVNVYELTHPGMAGALIRAHERGVAVTVLLEGGPVGGVSPEEKAVCWEMNQTGIPVYQMATTDSAHAPYRYDHAKYVVVDRSGVLICSENFKESGFPLAGYTGNRGWGVYLENEALAGYFKDVFVHDVTGTWVSPLPGKIGPKEDLTGGRYNTAYTPLEFSGARVTPVISPDTSHLVTLLLESAEGSIDIEEAYISNASSSELNPFLAAAINASRRGVQVRVLLDSYWYNIEDDTDNDEMVAFINDIARAENLPLEARCAVLGAGRPDKIHNKGVIVDQKQVLISSINWNSNSPTFNREAGVIIDHPSVARYYIQVFEDDWNSSGPGVYQGGIDQVKIALGIAIIILLSLYMVYRRRQ